MTAQERERQRHRNAALAGMRAKMSSIRSSGRIGNVDASLAVLHGGDIARRWRLAVAGLVSWSSSINA